MPYSKQGKKPKVKKPMKKGYTSGHDTPKKSDKTVNSFYRPMDSHNTDVESY